MLQARKQQQVTPESNNMRQDEQGLLYVVKFLRHLIHQSS